MDRKTDSVSVPGILGRMSPEALSELIFNIANTLVSEGKAGTLTADLIPPQAKFAVMRPKDRAHGDWASNAAMQLAKKAGMKPRDLATGQEAPGRVVGVGDKHHFRTLSDTAEQRVDIRSVISIGGDHRRCPAAPRRDVIQRKSIADVDNLIAGASEYACRERQQFARSGAHDNPRRINTVQVAQRSAQRVAVRIGIERRHGCRAARRQCQRAGSQRIFVCRQLDQGTAISAGRLSRDIGMNLVDPRFRQWFGCKITGHNVAVLSARCLRLTGQIDRNAPLPQVPRCNHGQRKPLCRQKPRARRAASA